MTADTKYDVFLSYAGKDKSVAEDLAHRLRIEGLEPFLDKWHLVPGEPWEEALEVALDLSRTCAVLLGPGGPGPWQNEEMRVALNERVQNKSHRVIPVLLPGSAMPEAKEPQRFLKRLTWVDFRGGLDNPREFYRLLCGIRGIVPGPDDPVSEPSRPEPSPPKLLRKPWLSRPQLLFLLSSILVITIGMIVYSLVKCQPGEFRTEKGIVFVRICPGTFMMGSSDNDLSAESDERPAHKVTLNEFWISRTEITNEQYSRLIKGKVKPGTAMLPVTNVSWVDAQAACTAFGARLPTEAEWEYAARAGTSARWSFGDDEKMIDDYAWYNQNSSRKPHPVSGKSPNAWGLYDMHGNVYEWVADFYASYTPEEQVNPAGPPSGTERVLRGGTYDHSAKGMRSTYRNHQDPDKEPEEDFGFRCVLEAGRQP